MKKETVFNLEVCGKCQKIYYGVPSVSRIDNKMLICSDCGTREALESLGVDPDEQEQILDTIHKHERLN